MSTSPFALTSRRSKPNLIADGSAQGARGGSYGEEYGLSLVPTKHVLADEGSYFTCCMTPGQANITYGVQATFADIAGFIVIGNGNPPGGPRVSVDYLKMLIATAAPASAASAQMAVKTDSANRVPTAQSTKITPVNVNADSPLASQSTVWFPAAGTITVPAAGIAARLVVGNLQLRGALPTIGDEYIVYFGGSDRGETETAVVATATAIRRQAAAPPLVIGGGEFGLIHLWFPSNAATAAQFSNIELGYWER